jgi:seryl-tRNA synthetase
LPKTSLKESIDKELAAINKEAEHEIIASKLEKVQALIDKKQSQISRLDEDEDMKDLTDAKKVKEISKDIKALEKAKAKLEKMIHKGKSKTPRKEVIDEVDIEPTEGYLAAKEDAEQRYDEGEEIDSIILNYQNLSFDDRNMLRQDLEGKMDGMDY